MVLKLKYYNSINQWVSFMKNEQNKCVNHSYSHSDVNVQIHENVRIFKKLVAMKEMYTCSLPGVNGA